LRDLFHRKAPYQSYINNQTGIFPIAASDGGPLTIAVVADWGTGTMEAETVAQNIGECRPHVTVHLGDVYYMGESLEIRENCLGQPNNGYNGVCWPVGSHGSFALMGNHEMYSGGQGYFKEFLPNLGLFDAEEKVIRSQSASFFCLEAEHWLILGLDTGYHSGGIPALTAVPFINSIPFLDVDARFDHRMMAWLDHPIRELCSNRAAKKNIVVLTHHQPISSFEHAYQRPVEQLATLDFLCNREIVWLFGHEHRLTIYKKQALTRSLSTYPRCIGHGGMPVEVTVVASSDRRILCYDPRKHAIDSQDIDTMVGYNGHVVLIFDGKALTIEYHDILKNKLLLSESFTPNATNGLNYSSHKPSDSPLVHR
jgi:hypothetical protein